MTMTVDGCGVASCERVPFTSISNPEIEALPPLGKTVKCWECGEEHEVDRGESRTLAFFYCPMTNSDYVCGIYGKEWRPKHAR